MERADVQRVRVAQRGRRCARREWLMHVDEVELSVLQQLLHRPRDVDRDRNSAAAPRREALPDRQELGTTRLAEERVGVAAYASDQVASLADHLANRRRRDHHYAVAAAA